MAGAEQPAECWDNLGVHEPVSATHPVRGGTPDEVFSALSDVSQFGEWALGLRSASIVDSPAGNTEGLVAGTDFEFVLSAAGLTHRVKSTVTAVDPPWSIGWRYTEGAVGTGGWSVEAVAGTVYVTLHTDYEVEPAWLNRLAHTPFFRGITRDLLRRSIRRFAESFAGDG